MENSRNNSWVCWVHLGHDSFFVQHALSVYAATRESLSSRPSYQNGCHGITVLVFKEPLFDLIMAPKHKRGDANNSKMPKRSQKALPSSESSHLIRRKNCMLRLLRSVVRMNLLLMKLWRKKKKFVLVLSLFCLIYKLNLYHSYLCLGNT